jgi:PKD repeat protein
MKRLNLILVIYVLFSCAKEPIADFTFTDNQQAQSNIIFTNTSQNAVSYSWNFGDNSTSSDISPTHSFLKPGVYLVTLTAYGEKENATASKNINIIGTTFSVINSSSFVLSEVSTFYWNGYTGEGYVNHGILNQNEETEPVLTTYSQLFIAFIVESFFCMTAYPFDITSNTHNTLVIDDYTLLYCEKGCSDETQENKEVFKYLKTANHGALANY